MEKIFTESEISKILNEAEHHYTKIWKAQEYFQFWNKKPLDILIVTPYKELILVKGNEDTGFDHIKHRHEFFSTNIYRKPENKGFEEPSKFRMDLYHYDFPRICDTLYETKNLNVENNKRPDLFDVYDGIFENEPHRLILYTNTKIIHTLIPLKSHSKKKKLSKFIFTRGKVEVKTDNVNIRRQILIPYLDLNFDMKYAILISKSKLTNNEIWEILIFDKPNVSNLRIKIGENPLRWLGEVSERLFFQHDDLRQAESYIKKIDNDIKTGKLNIEEFLKE